ncbi:MAG: hypothetical protein ACRDZ4_19950 [Egibacteraceae bacterium]
MSVPDASVVDGRLRVNSPEARNPRLAVSLYAGDLGLERPVPLSSPDWDVGYAHALTGLVDTAIPLARQFSTATSPMCRHRSDPGSAELI